MCALQDCGYYSGSRAGLLATPLCAAACNTVYRISVHPGITDTIEDFRILPQSTLQLIRIVGILEHLTRCHDDTQTDDNMRELADLIKCLSHFPELLKEDVAAVMDVIVSSCNHCRSLSVN